MSDNGSCEQHHVLSLLGYRFYRERGDTEMDNAFWEALKYPEREREIYESHGITEYCKLESMRFSMSWLFHSELTAKHYEQLGFSAFHWHHYFLSSPAHQHSYQYGIMSKTMDVEFLKFVENKFNDKRTKKIERYANMIWKCGQKKRLL